MRAFKGLFLGGLVGVVGIAACGSDECDGETGSCFDKTTGDGGSIGDKDGTTSGDTQTIIDFDSQPTCSDASCPVGFVCGASGACVPATTQCKNNDECKNDTYCKAGTCTAYGAGTDHDSACSFSVTPGNFAPKIKCEFGAVLPIAGNAFPDHGDVQATPMVARLYGPTEPPSIVVPFEKWVGPPGSSNYTEDLGVIRVLKGSDCSEQAVIGGTDLDADGLIDWARSSSPVALADLDGDKMPEIVAYMSSRTSGNVGGANETLVAFTRKSGSWAPLWAKVKATEADGVTIVKSTVPGVGTGGSGNWAGPAIYDLDDDGIPEIIREGIVFDGLTGKKRAALPTGYATYRVGIDPVMANLDADAKVELTNGAKIWEFDGATNAWVGDAVYNAVTTPAGWSAVADFNPYDGLKTPEIVVVSSNKVTIYNLAHQVFMGMDIAMPKPAALSGDAGGGPPTIADFDGDGLPEIGVAGKGAYAVFDPDCQAVPRTGGKCIDRTHCDFATGGACPDKILWSRATQDISSNITGSSVFDFEADGRAEVVYGDECFARVYSGTDGDVVFSRYRSSCTWLENPIIADVDGDFRAEMIIPNNTACGAFSVGQPCTLNVSGADQIDTQFKGLICQKGTDCVSGVCDQGLCRCTTTAECCPAKTDAACTEAGTKCAAPPVGTPGTGNTCRAGHPHGVHGIKVYEDSADRWVRSRPIWNQHAYAVTHINEDGTVPKTSQWATNWTQPELNNFRQNVPGTQNTSTIGDFTSRGTTGYSCVGTTAHLVVDVCNRGAAPVGSDVSVGFYLGTDKVCGAKTKQTLAVGACESVSCDWLTPPNSSAASVTLTVVPNDDNALAECSKNNNGTAVAAVFCTGIN